MVMGDISNERRFELRVDEGAMWEKMRFATSDLVQQTILRPGVGTTAFLLVARLWGGLSSIEFEGEWRERWELLPEAVSSEGGLLLDG